MVEITFKMYVTDDVANSFLAAESANGNTTRTAKNGPHKGITVASSAANVCGSHEAVDGYIKFTAVDATDDLGCQRRDEGV